MTRQEFSDTFTTLLNSYNTTALFGEQASRAEVVLDEYEKSVLLTQAQDIVVKSYFKRETNQQGEGFDDSTRRQVDFSSLIKVALLNPVESNLLYDDRGVLFKMPRKVVNGHPLEDTTDVLFILNEKLLVETTLNDGSPKVWTLNNYGDGTKKYYEEPTLTNIDLSRYYMISGDDTHYYKNPGTPEYHKGSDTYWTITGDPRNYHYPEYPSYTFVDGSSKYYTINEETKRYYSLPVIESHVGIQGYWYVDLDPDTKLYEDPGEPVHTEEIPESWTIKSKLHDETYYEAIEVATNTATDTYWTIDLDNPTVIYDTDPGTASEIVTQNEYWTIDGDSYSTEPGEVITHHGTADIWLVNEQYEFDHDPSNEFNISQVYYWKTSVTGDQQFAYNPVKKYTANPYWIDVSDNREDESGESGDSGDSGDEIGSGTIGAAGGRGDVIPDPMRPSTNSNYHEFYLGSTPEISSLSQRPTWVYEDEHSQYRVGFYITSNYGIHLGVFKYQPKFEPVYADLNFWLVDDVFTNPYFEEVTAEKIIESSTWSIEWKEGQILTFTSEPSVRKVSGISTSYTVTVGSDTLTFDHLPEIKHYPKESYWKFPDLETHYPSQPIVTPHTNGTTYYEVVYTNDGTGHSAGDSVNNVQYDVIPTIQHQERVPEYWTIAGKTYDTQPTVKPVPGQEAYWTINVNPGVVYRPRPVIHTWEGSDPVWIINSDGYRFSSEPEIISHEGTGSYWKFNGIDKEFYTNEPPTVTSVTDPNPELNYWLINDEGTHYFGNGKPAFDIDEGVYTGKSRKEYIIVPISYKEYDREMSKPYAQPLKKQAWRLFQNNSSGFDFDSELIPKFNIQQQVANPAQPGFSTGDVVLRYKIRYIRRPRPIILEDLPDGLEVDGESMHSDCELNPIMHMDILNKAVELALATRGRVQQSADEQRR